MSVSTSLPATMNAMVLMARGQPLVYKAVPMPAWSSVQVLIKVIACGVCRTDLHILDGELTEPKLPLIPGHEIIGVVARVGADVVALKEGDLVGVPWLGYTCGTCKYCRKGQENLCDNAGFTGYTIDGGFAEYTVADGRYCFPLSRSFADPSKAPLLCAGLIGYRSFRMIPDDAENIGIYGFGAAAHILIQVAVARGKKIFAFTRQGDIAAQDLARRFNASWIGDSSQRPPVQLDAAIIFAPAGELIPKALADTGKGGVVVCGGIHMSDIPSFPYNILWGERVVRSVANLTRSDAEDFLKIASEVSIETETKFFPLAEANDAIAGLKSGTVQGAAVLVMH